jgi:hypothetical protein
VTPKKKLASNAKNKQLLLRARRRKFNSSGVSYLPQKQKIIYRRKKRKKESISTSEGATVFQTLMMGLRVGLC